MSFCSQLDKSSKIRVKVFLQLKWVNVHDKYVQFFVSDMIIVQLRVLATKH